jgi:hypothetical protein
MNICGAWHEVFHENYGKRVLLLGRGEVGSISRKK